VNYDSIFKNVGKDVDNRGYYLVERWVLSIIQTENPAKVIGEGLTKIKNIGTLKEISESCPEKVFGNYLKSWPLIKVLDIGGDPVKTSFGTTERPPIPPHIHAGCIHNGKADLKCGKAEAQYFPPISAMTGQENKCVTRMGFKKGVTKEDVEKAMAEFGKSDAVYHLMQDYEVAHMHLTCTSDFIESKR